MSLRGAAPTYWDYARKHKYKHKSPITNAFLNASNTVVYPSIALFNNMTGNLRGAKRKIQATMNSDGTVSSHKSLDVQAPIEAKTSAQTRVTPALGAGSSTGALSIYKGEPFNKRWVDSRSRIEKIIEPILQLQTTEIGTAEITSIGGVQAVNGYAYNMLSKTQINELIDAYTAAYQVTGVTSNTTSFATKGGAVSILPGNAAASKNTGSYLFPKSQVQSTFYNPTNDDAYMTLYEYECVNDTSSSPVAFWQEYYTPNNSLFDTGNVTGIQTVSVNGVATATNKTENALGEVPCGKALHMYWRLINRVRVKIPSNKEFAYCTTKGGFKISEARLEDGLFYLKGISRYMFTVLHGDKVQSNLAITFGTGDAALRHKTMCNFVYTAYTLVTVPKRISLGAVGTNAGGEVPILTANQVHDIQQTGAAVLYDRTDI